MTCVDVEGMGAEGEKGGGEKQQEEEEAVRAERKARSCKDRDRKGRREGEEEIRGDKSKEGRGKRVKGKRR